MVDSSDVMKANSEAFQYKLEVIEFQITQATKALLANDEISVFCLNTEDTEVTRVLLAQVLRTLKKGEFLKQNYNVIFTDFGKFTTMSLKQNEEWANNLPDLLICKLTEEEKLDKQFYILKSWMYIVKEKSKKIMFIVKDSESLQRNMMKIGMANIFKLKLDKLWTDNEMISNNEVACEVENNEATSNVLNNESTSARALDEDTNVNVIGESSGKTLLNRGVISDNSDTVNLPPSLSVTKLDAVDNDGNTKLHLAARDGKTQIVESLLAYGAKKDLKNNIGRTALHLAVMKGHNAIVQLLLEHGFHINATNLQFKQFTPLHYACYFHNDAYLIEILLKFGAEIDRKDKNDRTALHLASFRGHSAVVNSLLKSGANINAQDKYGDSPLHDATRWNNQEIVLILLQHGADMNIENKKQRSALILARLKKFTNIIQIFENHVITKKKMSR